MVADIFGDESLKQERIGEGFGLGQAAFGPRQMQSIKAGETEPFELAGASGFVCVADDFVYAMVEPIVLSFASHIGIHQF